MTLLDAALGYARRGWRVFPVRPCSKVPLLQDWPHVATTDEDAVSTWWARWPDANVAVATGDGLLVVDVDPRHGGNASLHDLERAHGPLPDTPRVLTGGGGLHVYFAITEPIGNRAGTVPGIDLRGHGGFVVGPPSFHPSGRRYAWETGSSPDDVQLALAPQWLLDRLRRRDDRDRSGDRLRANGTPLVLHEGYRNDHLFRLACAWRRQGLSAEAIRGCLAVTNREHCQPPLPDYEVMTIATSAGRYPPAPLDDDERPANPPDSDDARVPATATSAARISRPLTAILADPSALEPPAVVVPRLAWRGRTTLLAAREKAGKSTLATAAAAAVTRGAPWLGDPSPGGTVLWVALEEHVSDVARRWDDWKADAERVYVVESLHGVEDPLAALYAEARAVTPILIVVDTLSALVDAIGSRPDPGSSTAWTPIMAALTRLARDTEAAVLVLHHARRSDGAYRDSSAIGAGVDVIVEMTDGADGDRVLKVRGRWQVSDYAVRLVGNQYNLATGEPSLDTRVLLFIEAHPRCSQRAVEQGVPARAKDVRAAIRRLLASDAVRNDGTETTMRLFRGGTHSGTHPVENPDALGHASDAGGTQPDALVGRGVRPNAKPHGAESGRTPREEVDL
jgi:hypothetical protein